MALASGPPRARLDEDNGDQAHRRAYTMAVIVKYVVVADGTDDMIFCTKQEAEAHDTMLGIAERLYAWLETAEIPLAEDTLEVLTIFMARHRAHLSTLLKGGKLQTPAVRTPHAAVPSATRDEDSAAAPRRSKASPSAPPTPQAAA